MSGLLRAEETEAAIRSGHDSPRRRRCQLRPLGLISPPLLPAGRDARMPTTITNYDGGIVTTPQQVVAPRTVEEVQAVLAQPDRYPGPVRAMGSNHSLTPCASSPGTIV